MPVTTTFRSSNFRSSKTLSTRLLLAAASSLLAVGGAHAQVVALNNPSFELPTITPNPGSQDPADFVLPFIDGWDETGPITTQQGFTGRLDTGVFINTPIQIDENTIIPPIPNADGNQLAFMQVNPLADGINEELVSISQETAALFQLDTDYDFTIGVGHGVLFPPTGEPGNLASIELTIGYNDPINPGFQVVESFTLNADDLYPTNIPNFPPILIDLTVTATAERIGGPWPNTNPVGNEIVVKVTQLGGTGGGFNLDKASLIAVAPADLDRDGDVDDADFGIAFAAFTGPDNGPSNNPDADLDGDGDVDDADFGLAFGAFTGPGGSPAAVPEPGSLALLGLAAMAGLRRRR